MWLYFSILPLPIMIAKISPESPDVICTTVPPHNQGHQIVESNLRPTPNVQLDYILKSPIKDKDNKWKEFHTFSD